MISKLTLLDVTDNSGARSALCICILRVRRRLAVVGDELIVSIRGALVSKRIAKGDVKLALLVRQKRWFRRDNGLRISFKRNAIVILSLKDRTLFGNRVKGPVTQELRKKHHLRVVCLAPSVV